MPEQLSKEEVDSTTDPSVSKQWDRDTPMDQQFEEFYQFADKMKIGLLSTYRKTDDMEGPVARAMAVAKRAGPDFLFLANKHSQKFDDLSKHKICQVTFQNSNSQDWASITGQCQTLDNSDPRIKELYNPAISAWFGDLGDGVHNGTPDDPRMALIEVKATYIAHWKTTSSTLGYMKEVAVGAATGRVAQTGVNRHMFGPDIEKARSQSS